jgi:hypothetical protein
MLKSITFALSLIFLIAGAFAAYAQFKPEINPSYKLLPTELKIYPLLDGGANANKKDETAKGVILPTVNSWLADPGCYVTCHTKDETLGLYAAENGSYVVGQMRIPGYYDKDGMCVTRLKKDEDMATSRRFKYMCNVSFNLPCQRESCWAEAKTGQWFESRN